MENLASGLFFDGIDKHFGGTYALKDVSLSVGRGEIVALLDAISKSGAYQTIAINLGNRDGLETGNILRIRRAGDVVRDLKVEDPEFRVKLPDEQIGMAMIIRSFEKMSYALIMEADMPISVNDYVESP